MRLRSALTTAAAGAVLVLAPTAALAQDVTGDPNDLDGTFVPGASSGTAAPDTSDGAAAQADTTADELPQTGGGLALLGGAAVAAGAAISRRRA